MKKLLLITSLILFISCSKDDNNEDDEMIIAEEYGMIVRAPSADYSYKFLAEPSGEIITQGERNGEQIIFFPVGQKEITAEYLHFKLEVQNGSLDDFKVFLIARKDDLYLNYEDSPTATSVFEMNNTKENNGVIEGLIPIRMHQNFWVKNSEWSNN